jgi:hypothetical protein
MSVDILEDAQILEETLLEEAARLAELLAGGQLEEARYALDTLTAQGHGAALALRVRRIQLGMYDGSLPSALAMKELVDVMRADQHTPGAKELYLEAAQMQHSQGHSSMAHSHPPPPPSKG